MVGRGQVIDFEQARYELSATREITLDECYTKDSLKGEVSRYVDALPISNTDKVDVLRYIITSFSKTGLIETYNDLGNDEWHRMVRRMVYQEYVTRCIERISNSCTV